MCYSRFPTIHNLKITLPGTALTLHSSLHTQTLNHTCILTEALLFLYTTVNPLLSGADTMPTLFLCISPLYRNELRFVRLFGSVLKGFLIFLFFIRYALLLRMINHVKCADILKLPRKKRTESKITRGKYNHSSSRSLPFTRLNVSCTYSAISCGWW